MRTVQLSCDAPRRHARRSHAVRTCPRRGRYISRICIVGTTVFANKRSVARSAPTAFGQNQKQTCVQRASLVWERTCPRRRWFERFNFDDCNDPFADKSAPTER
ncbi:Ca2+/H+ antiporter [Pseudomonas syringae pv. actinidiae]|uniref:Ca2+/H+ antiporter n=1 Tax=Pseudomonas syringae pv. actinidiae TaxID=103796 RepID=A0A2V0QT90_PSESF|nr:Ca2+/H+ antiporter [Pseudomonas syringae pv. actinidiae]